MDKLQLRQQAMTYLKYLPKNEQQTIGEKLTDHLIQSDIWNNASSIGVTISQGFEWDTKAIIDATWKANKQVSVPKCDPATKDLTFYQLDTYEQLEVVYFNLKEPNPVKSQKTGKADIDLLIVPGLLFDKSGYRIGFGGGYYDRFMADFTNVTVSLVSNVQVMEDIPKETFDLPVDYLITEDGIL